jgi:DNA-binding NarL/FixJ family response regulator
MDNKPGATSILHVEADVLWGLCVEHAVRDNTKLLYRGRATTCDQALHMIRQGNAGIIVLEPSLPGHDGVEVLRQITRHPAGPRVLLLTTRSDEATLLYGHRHCSGGMISKQACTAAELERALEVLREGGKFVSPNIRERIGQLFRDSRAFFKILSERELEVVRLAAQGMSDADIAACLGISRLTAKSHRAHILKKLELTSSQALVVWAVRRGFTITPGHSLESR